MGFVDSARNAMQRFVGMGKEKAGDATDDHDLQTRGKADQSDAELRSVVEDVKDTFKK